MEKAFSGVLFLAVYPFLFSRVLFFLCLKIGTRSLACCCGLIHEPAVLKMSGQRRLPWLLLQ